MKLFTTLFFLILCSKFYFQWGYLNGTHLAAAPIWLVAIRDLIVLMFFTVLSLKTSKADISSAYTKSRKTFVSLGILLALGLAASLAQVIGSKSAWTVLQHYLRNGLLPLFFFPAGLLLLARKTEFPDLKKCLKLFLLVNLVASYPQLLWTELMWVNRPTGLLGDPLLNSVFILMGLWVLFQDREKHPTWHLYTTLAVAIPILFFSNSLTSLISFGIAATLIVVFELHSQKEKSAWLRSRLPRLGAAAFICLTIFGALAFSFRHQDPEAKELGVAAKFGLLMDSIFCKDNCGKKEWFVEGRLRSNLLPIHLCVDNPTQCILGHWENPEYYRVDSLWSSLTVNWGIPFMLLYLYIFLITPLKKVFQNGIHGNELKFAFFIFALYWIFSIFNSGFYKHPLNILFYISVALLHCSSQQRKI